MANPQLHPLQVNKRTGEPYLRLPSPNDKIILTPPRLPDDIPPSVAFLNDPKIYPWMGSMKHHPYLPEHAEASLTKVKARSDRVLHELAEAASNDELRVVDVCPIGCIREELEDGSDVYIGDIGFSRCTWPEVTDVEERERLIAENEAKKPGDPEIIWQIGGESYFFFRRSALLRSMSRLPGTKSSSQRDNEYSARTNYTPMGYSSNGGAPYSCQFVYGKPRKRWGVQEERVCASRYSEGFFQRGGGKRDCAASRMDSSCRYLNNLHGSHGDYIRELPSIFAPRRSESRAGGCRVSGAVLWQCPSRKRQFLQCFECNGFLLHFISSFSSTIWVVSVQQPLALLSPSPLQFYSHSYPLVSHGSNLSSFLEPISLSVHTTVRSYLGP